MQATPDKEQSTLNVPRAIGDPSLRLANESQRV